MSYWGMPQEKEPPLSAAGERVARRWLIWQHGMTAEEAEEAMTCQCTPGSRTGRLRAEATEVGIFVSEGFS